MTPGQSLPAVTARILAKLEPVVAAAKPHFIIVQGDTTSTLGAALAAFHHSIPVAHVEAGLRSNDLRLPFPEEMNRRVTTLLAAWHFAPTKLAAENLAAEGIRTGVTVTGNTVVDAVKRIVSRTAQLPSKLAGFIGEGPYILATAHRRESWGGGIGRMAQALAEVLERFPEYRLVFATHPNPVARGPVDAAFAEHERVRILTAVEYGQFLRLLQGARLAITDSGGIQEEGPSLGIPVLVTRDVTERPEGVAAGAFRVVGTDVEQIVSCATEVLSDERVHAAMSTAGRDIYGDGHASERIVGTLRAALKI
jgi:UDP-N-acetylglucosamine 2-epimerase (non-hydrolysing)